MFAAACAPSLAALGASDLLGDGSDDRPFRKLSPSRDPRGREVFASAVEPLPLVDDGLAGLAEDADEVLPEVA
jgi:hypothetical protein